MRPMPIRLPRPRVLLFDWHATLVDTMDAMYYALDDVLPRLGPLGLLNRLVPPGESKTAEDERLVQYVRQHTSLHPKIKTERRISRTDIFELLFGADEEAKQIAHREFDALYERHFGAVRVLEPDARQQLLGLRARGIKLGVLSNRARRFMAHEIYTVDATGWHDLFDVMVCGDEVPRRKPFPDLILSALQQLGEPTDAHCWYVGDSVSDIVAGATAGVTPVFYNGVGWDDAWLQKIFPNTPRHPHQPEAVIGSLADLAERVDAAGSANRTDRVPPLTA